MKHFNLVYKIKKEKNWEKLRGGSSVNGICFNKKVFETSIYLQICESITKVLP